MDNVARLSAKDRRELFVAAAEKRGDMQADLIEKDFWVCWTLKRIFSLNNPPAGLVFKGGTSLSKVYDAINRFSEDVDLSFDRTALGFGGDNDPASAPSGNQAQRRLDDLSEACRVMIRDTFLSQLKKDFAEALGAEPSEKTWGIKADYDVEDGKTLVFDFPAAVAGKKKAIARYLLPAVRLEFGARGEQWPSETKTVSPYAAQATPVPFKDPHCTVKVLSAERTFWEKATILHAFYHRPADRPLPERQSRHYYDLAQLYDKKIGKAAALKLDLLADVAEHKKVFFRSSWANYDTAKPGSLRLVPPEGRREELAADYEKMREMIFGAAPLLSDILKKLKEMEERVNGVRRDKEGRAL